jgi:carboxyl-terminal processing protease
VPNGAPPDGPEKVVPLIRNEIKLEEQAAQKSLLNIENGQGQVKIGVIRVPTFYTDFEAREQGKKDFRSTTRDVRRLIEELQAEGIRGLLIDLRANGGGSLAEATELTGLFIKSGPIVQVRDYSGRLSVNDDPDPGIAYGGPLAVLVDRHSASASEIFAGAIQDYRRGLILGEPTFGKGTVQRLIDLSRFAPKSNASLGQLKFTVAQFFRINGHSTQHRGVVPDFVFPTVMDGDGSGERAFDNALPWAAVRPVAYSPSRLEAAIVDAVRVRHLQRIKQDPGFTYLLAEARADKQARERKSISLLESTRRQLRTENEQAALQRLNAYHQAVGLEPVKSLYIDEDEDKESRDRREKRAKERQNILRDEAAHILADLAATTRHKRLMTENP